MKQNKKKIEKKSTVCMEWSDEKCGQGANLGEIAKNGEKIDQEWSNSKRERESQIISSRIGNQLNWNKPKQTIQFILRNNIVVNNVL